MDKPFQALLNPIRMSSSHLERKNEGTTEHPTIKRQTK